MKTAIVLLSGGIDSALSLYIAKKQGYTCHCLTFDYGQRHKKEIQAAQKIAASAGCRLKLLKISLPWKGSSLLDNTLELNQRPPTNHRKNNDFPLSYVPARNMIFLSFAVSFAESINAEAVFIGAHQQDYSGYPDCRADFFQAFEKTVKAGTGCGVKGRLIKIIAPVLKLNKTQIIKQAIKLGVPLRFSWSCYRGNSVPCGRCESCFYRAMGFKGTGVKDPALRI
jgi:7-cyano-7-deazaguanine synthase